MRKHIALTPLSVEHHRGLVQARRLARAGDGKADVAATVGGYRAYAEKELASHLRREEEALLPEFARWVGADNPLIARTLVDHVALRERTLALLRADLEEVPVAPILAALSGLLESHIRFEERELFPAIARALPPERMAAVGVMLAAGSPGD